MKTILGLDLGVGSIGWALVKEAELPEEVSSIIRLGVRTNPLTIDEKNNFEKGKSITTASERTLKRSMHRNLQRYKLRRDALKSVLLNAGIIHEDTILCEYGKFTTHETYRLRATAATSPITLEQFARVLFAINKKRGYKSSRKLSTEDGVAIDGMSVAKYLYDNNLTPGAYCYELLTNGKKYLPEFYRSDLLNELNQIWRYQSTFYPDILTSDFYSQLEGKSQKQCTQIFYAKYQISTAENKGTDKKLQAYHWRERAIKEQITIEEVAFVISNICGEINNSSGYLGSISDRSKQLYFNQETVGQYLWKQLSNNRHNSIKNKAFYRQDYLDEFEIIWEVQAQYHKELTPELKKEIRDIIIFYQRRLKSKKAFLDICTLESHEKSVNHSGQVKTIKIGPKVCPISSPIFQEFRIWQRLNDTILTEYVINKNNGRREHISRTLTIEEKESVANELMITAKMKKSEVLKILFKSDKDKDLNFKEYDGNTTFAQIFAKCLAIVEYSGHKLPVKAKSAAQKIEVVKQIFFQLGYNANILDFDSLLDWGACYQQDYYKLWHLLYSFEGDNSKSGHERLIDKIMSITGMEREYAAILSGTTLQPDYGSLSSKAMHKILPFLREGNDYSQSCIYAGYKHSQSLTAEENEVRELKSRLDIIPKNSLRNPVVEKILNQMVHVVNSLLDNYGKIDEVRIELARELKHSLSEREDMYNAIDRATKENESIRKILIKDFHISHPSRNDVIRYKLYQELEATGYKTLYSNTYIPREKLFSKDFDIEHIIPRSRLFDDSFSNKTLEAREINIEKDNMTAYDYVAQKYNNDTNWGIDAYEARIDMLYKQGKIGKAKWKKLKMQGSQIPDDFIERDLRNSQYIAREAQRILLQVVRTVTPTVGAITARLREDWQLVDVMQELNWEKYDKVGATSTYYDKEGKPIKQITNWTKRNDNRHHAMDALTIAFTKPSYIQYLNNLNARSDKSSVIWAIEKKELERNGHNKLRFKAPIYPLSQFRNEAMQHLQMILVSIKAKNKVMTRNCNKTKKRGGYNHTIQLTPRGALHNETVYARRTQVAYIEKKIGATFTADVIAQVVVPVYRQALMDRLDAYGGDAKKAFTGRNSIDKNPIYIDRDKKQSIPSVVKLAQEDIVYTVRKSVAPDLNIDKVLDNNIKAILTARLNEYGGDAKQAFSNLDNNPIWYNKENGIAIKRVTLKGLNNAVPLHHKCDNRGNMIYDTNGNTIDSDFVNTGNNHHVAIYRDASGNLQEQVVSFMEAVNRYSHGLPVIDKKYRSNERWKFLFTMKQNEYFIFPDIEMGFNPSEIDLTAPQNYALISPYLYRVQKFSTKYYVFRHHLETKVDDVNELRNYTWRRIQNTAMLENIVKVRINHIGNIVAIGEE